MPTEPKDSKHLIALRALAEARKRAGPEWYTGDSHETGTLFVRETYEDAGTGERRTVWRDEVLFERQDDADFASAAANHDFPGLIAHVEKLERVAEKAKRAQEAHDLFLECADTTRSAHSAKAHKGAAFAMKDAMDALRKELETDHA